MAKTAGGGSLGPLATPLDRAGSRLGSPASYAALQSPGDASLGGTPRAVLPRPASASLGERDEEETTHPSTTERL